MLNKTFNFPDEAICGVKKSQFVFGFDFVEPCTEIVIVESIFNMFALGENVVASGGADILGTQIKKVLALRPERVILAPDNDEAGTKSLFHNFFLIESMTSVPVWYCLPPKGQSKDWSEIGERLGWDQPRNLYQQGLKRLDQAELISLGCHR
jgi:DNA primase